MLLQNSFIIYIFVQIYIITKSLKVKDLNSFRFLNETNITINLSEINETNNFSAINATNILSDINETNISSEINETNNFSAINTTNILSYINETDILTELNETNIPSGINKTNNTNGTYIETNEMEIIKTDCSSFSDCFNCTINKYCRWSWPNESCIEYTPFNENYSIPDLNQSLLADDISTINPFINFLRKTCFKPYIPYKENNSSLLYNDISKKYCGPHEITTISNSKFIKDFKIELNNVDGIYGVPNILCEYIILSGPNSFQVNIEINEKYNKSFYLLYSEYSIYFYDLFKESTSITIDSTGRRANTFIYYGLQSFDESPFKITFKEYVNEKPSQTTGYILIGLIIFIFLLVVISIIYIRYNSKLFDKNKDINDNKNTTEEEEKIGDKSGLIVKIMNNEKNTNIGNNKQNNQEIINNKIDEIKAPNTPDKLLTTKIQKQFTFENNKISNLNYTNEMNICCFDFQIINDINDIYKAKCGHSYHNQCFNKLFEHNINILGNKILKCVSCQQIIYP